MRNNKLLKELMDMDSYRDDEMDMGPEVDDEVDVDVEDEGPDGKKFYDEDEARGHAEEFMDRANEVLQYNKKEADKGEVCKLAQQFAKDYYEAIVDEINAKKYAKEDME